MEDTLACGLTCTCTNSSGSRPEQQLAVMESAFLCDVMLKKSRYVRQETTPRACRIALLCFLESVSSAERLCSATSMHWIDCSFSRNVGMASTMTAVDRGSASIM